MEIEIKESCGARWLGRINPRNPRNPHKEDREDKDDEDKDDEDNDDDCICLIQIQLNNSFALRVKRRASVAEMQQP